jgi:hypothetical protein
MNSRKIIIITATIWFLLALIVGASGILASIPMPFPQVVLSGLTVILMLLFWKSSGFRNWVLSVDIRALLLVHLSRFIGVYFLILHSRGELPYAFAVPGGLGDIAIAIAATLLLFISHQKGRIGFIDLFIWNILGLLDILFVVATAGRLGLANPASMSALTRLPLGLLPTFLVPIIIFTHIVIFLRLFRLQSKF